MKEISGEWPFFALQDICYKEISNEKEKFVYLQNLYEKQHRVYEMYTTRRILWTNSIMTLREELL